MACCRRVRASRRTLTWLGRGEMMACSALQLSISRPFRTRTGQGGHGRFAPTGGGPSASGIDIHRRREAERNANESGRLVPIQPIASCRAVCCGISCRTTLLLRMAAEGRDTQ